MIGDQYRNSQSPGMKLITWEKPLTSLFFALVCLPEAMVFTKWLHSGLLELRAMITYRASTGQGSSHFQHFMVVDVIPIINMQIMSLPEPRGLTPAPQSVGGGAPTWHQSLPSLSPVCTVQWTSEIPASKYEQYPVTCDLKNWSWWTYLQNRGTDIENNKLLTTSGERGKGINWEIRIDTYTLLFIKQIISKNLLFGIGNLTQCSVMTYMGKKTKNKWIHVCV